MRLAKNPKEQALIARIRTMHSKGHSLREISKKVGVPHMTVARIVKRG